MGLVTVDNPEMLWTIYSLYGFSFCGADNLLSLLHLQGNLHVGSVFGGKDSIQLTGSEITSELRYHLSLLTLCWHFSKKPFPLFLEETGYTEEDVLLQEPKAGVCQFQLE